MQKNFHLGVDVGGTKMTSVLLDENGRVIADLTLATPKDNLEHFLIMLKALADPLLERADKEKAQVEVIGLGIPGLISEDRGKILRCRNLPLLNNTKLPEIIRQKFGYRIVIDNDAHCFTLGEAELGAGKKLNSVYGVTIGTGIGGGWYVNNKIHLGANGNGSEPSRMIMDHGSLAGLEDLYHTLTENDPSEMANRAFTRDAKALENFESFGRLLGVALANIINLIGPEAIVIGGGVMESSELFLATAKKTMKDLIANPASKNTKILKAKLGQLAGAIGAGLLK